MSGTTEPNIQRQGADRILVQVPGLQDPQRLKELLGRTAKLEFRMLAEQGATDVDMLPSRDAGGQRIPVERRMIVEGGDLTDAQPAFDSRTNEPIVNFRFNIRGAQRFGQATSENVGRALAIVLDNEVISAPRILRRRSRAAPARFRATSPCSRPTTSRCCSGPAPCRPS